MYSHASSINELILVDIEVKQWTGLYLSPSHAVAMDERFEIRRIDPDRATNPDSREFSCVDEPANALLRDRQSLSYLPGR